MILKLMMHLIWLLWLIDCQCPPYTIKGCTFIFSNSSCSFLQCIFNTTDSSFTVSDQWGTCTVSCCSYYNGPNEPKTLQTIFQYCGLNNSVEIPIGVTIAVAIGLIIFILIVIICCIYFNLVTCACRCFSNLREGVHGVEQPAASQLDIAAAQRMKTEEVIVTEELFEERVNKHICSICLSEEATVVTQCGHQFHSACLAQWVKKKKSCPDCRGNQMQEFVVHCSKCFKSYQKTTELISDKDYLCKYCKM